MVFVQPMGDIVRVFHLQCEADTLDPFEWIQDHVDAEIVKSEANTEVFDDGTSVDYEIIYFENGLFMLVYESLEDAQAHANIPGGLEFHNEIAIDPETGEELASDDPMDTDYLPWFSEN